MKDNKPSNGEGRRVAALTGNEAVAEAMRQIDPDVVAAYPITPQTELMHAFADSVANGKVSTEFVLVESEHSAMSATVGASAAGARAMTATSSQGLALMWEVIQIASSLRLPIVMPVVNRALSGPINIHCDHSDTMGCRDSGWIQIFSENSQEAYDHTLIALRVAEHPRILLPVMVTLDGFILSHTMERVEIIDDEVVKKYIGEYHPDHPLLDIKNPVTVGPLDLQDYYFEHKRQEAEAQVSAAELIPSLFKEFAAVSSRDYDVIEEFEMEDAEMAIVVLGSTAGTVKTVTEELRREGKKVGVVKIRVFRPFPRGELVRTLRKVKTIAVLDRSIAFGSAGGPVFDEIRSAFFESGITPAEVNIVNYLYGLGGRDVKHSDIRFVYDELASLLHGGSTNEVVRYLGLRASEMEQIALGTEEHQ
jgi:pyruvate ferredoxin oxidoreductase alpha subunit